MNPPEPGRRWQTALEDECRRQNLGKPTYSTQSDRRGGRTAWSCTVTVAGYTLPARNWYDGNYIGNAHEDAAEVMLNYLKQRSNVSYQQLQSQAFEENQQQAQEWHDK